LQGLIDLLNKPHDVGRTVLGLEQQLGIECVGSLDTSFNQLTTNTHSGFKVTHKNSPLCFDPCTIRRLLKKCDHQGTELQQIVGLQGIKNRTGLLASKYPKGVMWGMHGVVI
jgi:hypothetical protein